MTRFHGTLINHRGETINLSLEHLLLRGCVLKNTEFIYAVVVYAGQFTKVMQNSVQSKIKRSTVDRMTNNFIKLIFVFQFIFCVIASLFAVLTLFWYKKNFHTFIPYESSNFAVYFFVRIGNWFLIFRYFY